VQFSHQPLAIAPDVSRSHSGSTIGSGRVFPAAGRPALRIGSAALRQVWVRDLSWSAEVEMVTIAQAPRESYDLQIGMWMNGEL
jgi:hypothetical protein